MDDDGNDADDEGEWDIYDEMDDGFFAVVDEALLDETQDGQSEIIIEDCIPGDPWQEVVNSSAKSANKDDLEEK